VFTGADGAVVVHRAVQHRIIRITMTIMFFKGITTVIMAMRAIFVEKPLFYIIFGNLLFSLQFMQKRSREMAHSKGGWFLSSPSIADPSAFFLCSHDFT
jgi:hypothetical protein